MLRHMLLALLFCAAIIPAQAAFGAPKIGVVDVDLITRRSRSIQNAVKQAEGQVRAQSDKVDAKVSQLQTMRQNLNDRRSVLKAEDVAAEQARIDRLREEIDDLKYDVNKQIDRIQREVMEPEVKRVMKTVEDVARSEGYDLVVRAEAVLFRSDAVDLTPLVIQALDRQSGAASRVEPTATPEASEKKAESSDSDDKSDTQKETPRKRTRRSRR